MDDSYQTREHDLALMKITLSFSTKKNFAMRFVLVLIATLATHH